MKKIARATVVVVGVLLAAPLSACSANSELGEVTDIDEVVQAYVDQGGECDAIEREASESPASASVECGDHGVISTFETRADREAIIDRQRVIFQALQPENESPLTLLVGSNWIINAEDAEGMQEALGGEWVTE